MSQNFIRENELPLRASGRPGFSDSLPRRLALFAASFIRHPNLVGTIFPSSPFIVRRTLQRVPWEVCEVLVEYGPGTGQFTREILRRMSPDSTLITIDINRSFVRFLRAASGDRRLRVVEGSAIDVRKILRRMGCSRVDCVIAGIPFRPLPAEMRKTIVAETHEALVEGGAMLVYQVSTVVFPHLKATFRQVEREFEMLNLLPTHLFRCVK